MSGEQSFGDWRAEQQRRAQAYAFGWAERATAEYETATRHEDDARRHSDSAYLRDAVIEDRRRALAHGVRSTEALKLAEMWARVAQALAVGEPPVTAELEVRGYPEPTRR
ncbi:hypothetical protein OG866_27050 [Streptomyces sp. NBC_00663]|uniref:hypothetical protein n=1 Tax=Streptomyces sp. NBC_00663 TaxID=2975801 RepID=UPI002E307507|nr:hypothetical protein [Streptomyces sp. NBC_00663]